MLPTKPDRAVRSPEPCRPSDAAAVIDPSGVSRADHEMVERLTAIHDVTSAVAGTLLDAPDAVADDLADVLELIARAASRRLGVNVRYWTPEVVDPAHEPAPTPDVCVPVVASGTTPGVGHLHLVCAVGTALTATDRVTLELLAGHAVDLAETQRRKREQAELVAQLRASLDAARHDIAGLTSALASNRQIGMAMGIIAAAERLTPEASFARLREASQHWNRKLRDIAEDVVLTGVLPPAPPEAHSAPRRPPTDASVSAGVDADQQAVANARAQLDAADAAFDAGLDDHVSMVELRMLDALVSKAAATHRSVDIPTGSSADQKLDGPAPGGVSER